jgi:hypothetical protein
MVVFLQGARRRLGLAGRVRGLFFAAAAAAVSACVSGGMADLTDPVSRQATWFSFLDGEDLRPACRAGAADRARLVYNGRYVDQVRVYEWTTTGRGTDLAGRVFTGGGLFRMEAGRGLGVVAGRPFRTAVDEEVAAGLWRRLAAAGAFRPAPRLTLTAGEVWWLAVGCHDGTVFFHAWPAGGEGFADLGFREALEPLDPTGIAFAPVTRRGVPLSMDEDAERLSFRLEVAPGGLMHR